MNHDREQRSQKNILKTIRKEWGKAVWAEKEKYGCNYYIGIPGIRCKGIPNYNKIKTPVTSSIPPMLSSPIPYTRDLAYFLVTLVARALRNINLFFVVSYRRQ